MRTFVISDLHIGGSPEHRDALGEVVDFRILPDSSQLRGFVDYLAEVRGQRRLVIAGDVIDYLAESDDHGEFHAFHPMDGAERTATIVAREPALFRAFERLLAAD